MNVRALYEAILNRLRAKDPVWYFDRRGKPIRITRDLVPLAVQADHNDPDPDEPIRPPMFWTLSEHGMRQILAIAHSEPDPEVAFLLVVAHTNWSEYEDDDDWDDWAEDDGHTTEDD